MFQLNFVDGSALLHYISMRSGCDHQRNPNNNDRYYIDGQLTMLLRDASLQLG